MALVIATDPEGKIPLHDMGEVLLGEERQIPFFIVNTGSFPAIKLTLDTTYPETEIKGSIPSDIPPKKAAPFTLLWKPGKETLALAKSKKSRTGEIRIKAMEVIE